MKTLPESQVAAYNRLRMMIDTYKNEPERLQEVADKIYGDGTIDKGRGQE